MNDLPVAIKRDDDHTRRSTIQPECDQGCAVNQEARGHCSRTWIVAIVKHSRDLHWESDRDRYTRYQLKGRMNIEQDEYHEDQESG